MPGRRHKSLCRTLVEYAGLLQYEGDLMFFMNPIDEVDDL